MTNELRKLLGRNMRYVQINNELDNEISRLEARRTYDLSAGPQIEVLKQQQEANNHKLNQPMSPAEYEEYDDYGNYIGNKGLQNQTEIQGLGGFGQALSDATNHFAQGASLGWSDELNGVIGGVGRVMANGVMRFLNQNVNGEDFGDAWNKGYQEYRDFARQELDDGSNRHPVISGGAEIAGSLISPVKMKGVKGAAGVGIIGGAGMTDENTIGEYATNIGLNTAGSIAGEKFGGMLGNKYGDRLKFMSFGLRNITKPVHIATKASFSGMTNQINNWRKSEDEE